MSGALLCSTNGPVPWCWLGPAVLAHDDVRTGALQLGVILEVGDVSADAGAIGMIAEVGMGPTMLIKEGLTAMSMTPVHKPESDCWVTAAEGICVLMEVCVIPWQLQACCVHASTAAPGRLICRDVIWTCWP